MIKVNLVPADIIAKAQARQRNIQIGAGIVVVLLVVAAVSYMHWNTKANTEIKLAEDQKELERLASIVAQVEEVERKSAEVKQRLGVVTDLLKGRALYPYFMSDFARSMPPGVYVKTVTTKTGANNTLTLDMAASARTTEDIQSWVKAMTETGKFSGAEIKGQVTAVDESGSRSFTFNMVASYAPKF